MTLNGNKVVANANWLTLKTLHVAKPFPLHGLRQTIKGHSSVGEQSTALQ